MWNEKDQKAKRFNEQLTYDMRSQERSNTLNSVKSLSKQVSLKKQHLDKLSSDKKANFVKSIEGKSGKTAGLRQALSSQKLKNFKPGSRKESSIKTAQLMSKINEFNQIQARIKKLETNIKAQTKKEEGTANEKPIDTEGEQQV